MLEPASRRFVKPIRRGGSEYSWAGAGLEHETWVWPERTPRFILMVKQKAN